MRSAEEHVIDIGPALFYPFGKAAGQRSAIDNFDADILQCPDVGAVTVQIVRPEGDLQSRVDEHLHVGKHRARAGVAIGLRYVMVDDEDMLAVAAAIAGKQDVLAIGVLPGSERSPPLLDEFAAIGLLIRL